MEEAHRAGATGRLAANDMTDGAVAAGAALAPHHQPAKLPSRSTPETDATATNIPGGSRQRFDRVIWSRAAGHGQT